MNAEPGAAGYTIHADPSVQHSAADVLRRSMRALPSQRNALLLGMASFASRLPEDFTEAGLPSILAQLFKVRQSGKCAGS